MFTTGFRKTANKDYDEHAEYTQANEVDRVLSKHQHPDQMKPAKPGTRVAYYSSDRGWKEGPWAHHTKGCSMDEQIDAEREEWRKQELKKHKLPDDFKKIKGEGQKEKQELHRKTTGDAHKKFPSHHHGKDWNKEAVGLGDVGTVQQVEKGGIPRYHVTWDKHPDCPWGGYLSKDLKLAPGGM